MRNFKPRRAPRLFFLIAITGVLSFINNSKAQFETGSIDNTTTDIRLIAFLSVGTSRDLDFATQTKESSITGLSNKGVVGFAIGTFTSSNEPNNLMTHPNKPTDSNDLMTVNNYKYEIIIPIFHVWYSDGTITQSHIKEDLSINGSESYSLPTGKSPSDVIDMGISTDQKVHTWYLDGTHKYWYTL